MARSILSEGSYQNRGINASGFLPQSAQKCSRDWIWAMAQKHSISAKVGTFSPTLEQGSGAGLQLEEAHGRSLAQICYSWAGLITRFFE